MLTPMIDYNRPFKCPQCEGLMVFVGVGEYHCEDCGFVGYDDYGKVRMYIEKHRGATAAEIEEATGVTQKSIRQMLREARIEITPESNVFLKCETCGKQIRSGRFCAECELNYHKRFEDEYRKKRQGKMEKVFGMDRKTVGDGEKRFRRDR